jgi:sec-independent protein translocase protein TatA
MDKKRIYYHSNSRLGGLMGLRHFGSLLIIFFILMMVFGTERLRNVGQDLAAAIRSFRKGMQEDEEGKQP